MSEQVIFVRIPSADASQVLVKVLACGVCHSDHAVRFGLFGNSFPIIPGHEVIGEVAAVPDTEKKWKVGDRVGGPWHGGHDSTCIPCQRGLFQMCEKEAINGVTRDGVCIAFRGAFMVVDIVLSGIRRIRDSEDRSSGPNSKQR